MSERGRRLLWFLGLWLAGVATVAGFAYLLRALLAPLFG
ncbi:hypothetical protein SAMN06265365_111127 [Tistlia consotensis]|uniref:DUF2474 domain-containing protein n=1 Tax=Tistlia consotensis USBA 355 TaxID=560819 RepID=A0A1Y6C2N5_9PROT|nr:DUF2474 domain-containing protein [Tistlia consotensis]SMF33574.1 Protein of unknown function [Tistlia consotensis USBA 355]SNR69863.1 hypothetical protein SAMN06265365_111127 [Tistlia consotensis]